MATFVTLLQFTDQGIRNVKDTTKRFEAARDLAKKMGVTFNEIYWTVGQYDSVAIVEAPNEEAVTSALLSVGALGNTRTQTLRAFSSEEMGRIISKMS
jgi:uncharacterized protein with GYD domain